MDELGIDFDAARGMSGEISALIDKNSSIKSKFNDAKSKINDMPPGFSITTSGVEGEIDSAFAIIEKGISNTVASFDACIDNYYKLEQESSGDKANKIEFQQTSLAQVKATNDFYWNYPGAAGKMEMLSDKRLNEFFTAQGAKKNGSVYTFSIDGKKYSYDSSTHTLTYGSGKKDKIDCIFYATPDTKVGDIENTITILSGSGSRDRGAIHEGNLSKNNALNDGSLVIIPYNSIASSDLNMSKTPNAIVSCTETGQFLAGKKTYNSIIGYSEGAQSAFGAASKKKGLYDTCVVANGSAYWTKDNVSMIDKHGSYEPFKDMDIIFIECKNNNNWNPSIKSTVRDLLKNRVPKENISFYTNDSVLIDYLDGINLDHIDISSNYSGHGEGWKMITDSKIISYLSNI